MKNDLNVFIGKLKACPICGKNFIPTVGWVYRDIQKSRWFCSYTCWRKAGGDGNDKKFKNKPTTNTFY